MLTSALFAILCFLSASSTVVGAAFNQKLFVISFDGFREAYLDDQADSLASLIAFRDSGAYSDKVESIFPSETFPNHYSIATGMYAESHGIVANSMFDPKLNKTFSRADPSSVWWDLAEPIWITAERQRKKTSVIFWPGAPVKFPPPGNFTPTYYRPVYSNSVPLDELIDESVRHLANDSVDLAMLYYYQPDYDGHDFGAPSSNVISKLKYIDSSVARLLTKLDQANLGKDKLNLILCSDHGMINITKFLFIEDYNISLTDDVERVPSYGAVVNLQPKEGRLDRVMEALNSAASSGEPFKAYRKQDLPFELHYSTNQRITDVVIICNLGIYMQPSRPPVKMVGAHGYDPKSPAMRPLFMARGPAFKSGGYRSANSFETKDIYAIISHVVGITPSRTTNASLNRVADLFAVSSSAHAITIKTATNIFNNSKLPIVSSLLLILLVSYF